MTKFEINNLTKRKVDERFLKKVGKKACKVLPRACRGVPEISIVIIGEKRMRELNKKYRRINKATDVLTFDYGEIFICPSKSREKNLAKLLIHGMLHLAGYHDNEIKEEKIWQKIIQ
jgi:probable rRNA maturation factor